MELLPPEPLDLQDLHFAPVIKLRDFYEAELQTLRKANDTCPMEKTEFLRGRIMEIKRLIKFLTPKESNDADNPVT